MDFIRPIGHERDVDPVLRVERAHDERERREHEAKERQERQPKEDAPATPDETPEGPVEGDDGHLHIDIRA
jgi:hypothetical protein